MAAVFFATIKIRLGLSWENGINKFPTIISTCTSIAFDNIEPYKDIHKILNVIGIYLKDPRSYTLAYETTSDNPEVNALIKKNKTQHLDFNYIPNVQTR